MMHIHETDNLCVCVCVCVCVQEVEVLRVKASRVDKLQVELNSQRERLEDTSRAQSKLKVHNYNPLLSFSFPPLPSFSLYSLIPTPTHVYSIISSLSLPPSISPSLPFTRS